jgi:type I restriction enzyme R subunit
MVTGSGKTRTVIALTDMLMRATGSNGCWFLPDRVALVKQAGNAFKTFLPDSAPVNLLTEKNTEGRVYVSTYPTMMRLINELDDGRRQFGPGHFDWWSSMRRTGRCIRSTGASSSISTRCCWD